MQNVSIVSIVNIVSIVSIVSIVVRRHFVPRHIVPGHILSRDNMSLLKSVLKVVVGVHRRDILSRWCSSRGDILSRYQLFGNK